MASIKGLTWNFQIVSSSRVDKLVLRWLYSRTQVLERITTISDALEWNTTLLLILGGVSKFEVTVRIIEMRENNVDKADLVDHQTSQKTGPIVCDCDTLISLFRVNTYRRLSRRGSCVRRLLPRHRVLTLSGLLLLENSVLLCWVNFMSV